MDKLSKMKEMVDLLNKASNAYYNSGDTIMSDLEFDTKLSELKALEEETGIVMSNSPLHKVGSKVLNELPEVKHNHPMLSLAKCHSAQEIYNWAKGEDLIAMVKCDGLTCSLKYIDGEYVSAETRGDGEIGNDVTEHIKHFTNVPMHINKSGTYIVDGEAIIFQHDFEEINKDGKFKNPRNTAAGTLNLLDVSEVSKRRLSFIAWDVIEGSEYDSLWEKLSECKKLGFTNVPFSYSKNDKVVYGIDAEYIDMVNEDIQNMAQRQGIPMDGVVWKINDCTRFELRGRTEHHFSGGIAWKPAKVEKETQLLDIEFSMGKTGILTPTAVFKPIELDGTTVERASMHNVTIMEDLLGEHPYRGQKIGVFKANMIIPQVSWADTEFEYEEDLPSSDKWIYLPTTCPVCGGQVQVKKENDTENLVCINPNCSGKLLGKLNHFVSKSCMNIDGLSEATLSFLIDMGWIKSYVDIYMIKNNSDIITRWKNTNGFGVKSVDKILRSVEESRNTTLERMIDAISIPLIGTKAAKDISKYCKGDVHIFIELVTTNVNELQSIDGIGERMISEIKKWIKSPESGDFLDLIGLVHINKPQEVQTNVNLSGKVFVITGSLEKFANRDELISKLESVGAKVSGSVSKKTHYLINNDVNSNSSKNVKARELGIPILNEEELLKMF